MESKQPQIAVDPNLAAEQQQAQNSLVNNLQSQAQIDTANLMTRYGTRLALSGGGMSPISDTGAAPPPAFGAIGSRAA